MRQDGDLVVDSLFSKRYILVLLQLAGFMVCYYTARGDIAMPPKNQHPAEDGRPFHETSRREFTLK